MNHPDYSNLPGEGSRPRPKSGPNLFLLLILGGMALFLYTQYKNASPPGSANRDHAVPSEDARRTGPGVDISIPDFSNDNVHSESAGTLPNTNNEWSIDTDIRSQGQEAVVVGPHGLDTTQSGDWTIEVGESKISADSKELKTAPKTTRKGEWEISEVDSGR